MQSSLGEAGARSGRRRWIRPRLGSSSSDKAGTGSLTVGRPLSVSTGGRYAGLRRKCGSSARVPLFNGGANLSKFTVKLLCHKNVEWIQLVGDIIPAVTQASARSYLPRPLFSPLKQLSMSSRASTDWLLGDVDINPEYTTPSHTDNFDSCSAERRRQIEKSLLRKLDLRVSLLVLIWLMNIVGSLRDCSCRGGFLTTFQVDRINIAWVYQPAPSPKA